jgi:hypothetical protein
MTVSLDGLQPRPRPHAGCAIGRRLFPLLDEKARKQFVALLADPDWSDDGRTAALNKRLEAAGVNLHIDRQTMRRHRRGECSCHRLDL